MSGWKRWGLVVVAGSCLCLVFTLSGNSEKRLAETRELLTGVKLAPLPEGVTEARCSAGGIFAKHVHIKFTASQEQALAYLTAGEIPYYSEFTATGDTFTVSETHVLTKTSRAPDGRALPERKSRMVGPKWFRSVGEIRHGWFYEYVATDPSEGPVGYQFYYDLDAGQFYIYWYYS